MAREYGRIWISAWKDFEFTHLTASEQWLYFALISQPGLSTCGVQSHAPSRWATLAEDMTARKVERAVTRLETARLVVVDRDTDELLIRSHIRYDKPLRTANVAKAVARTWEQVASTELQKAILVELARLHGEEEFKDWAGWQTPEIRKLLQIPIRKDTT
jgi:hypothetical protein